MSDTDIRQRLAAILAADGVGYSRLMALDERATLTALDAARAVFRCAIESHKDASSTWLAIRFLPCSTLQLER